MKEYHKIMTLFKRDPGNRFKTVIEGEYALPEFKYLEHNTWVFTEKVDGTNIRIMYNGNEIKFGGKAGNSEIPAFLVNKLNKLCDIGLFQEIFGNTSVCLYGEGYGAKIQKGGGNYRKGQSFVLFDIFIDGWWLKRELVEDMAEGLTLDIVPVIDKGTLCDMKDMVKSGFNSTWGNFKAEGIVARPEIELFSRKRERIITKLKYRDMEK